MEKSQIMQAIALALQEIAEKLVAAAAEALPAVTAEDNGKALLVSGGEWGAGALPVELPAVTAEDNGKVLTVVDGAWAAAAATQDQNE